MYYTVAAVVEHAFPIEKPDKPNRDTLESLEIILIMFHLQVRAVDFLANQVQ